MEPMTVIGVVAAIAALIALQASGHLDGPATGNPPAVTADDE